MLSNSENKEVVIAAIDIGTNSAHMVVARVSGDDGHMNVLDIHKKVLRLGDAINPKDSRISPEAIDRTVESIRQMKEIAAVYQPIFRAVATHATRIAANGQELIEAIYAGTKIRVEIIDGFEEARLAALGMQSALPLGEKRFLGVDIGGGSTEIVLCQMFDIKYVSSIQLGSVILTNKFLSPKKVKNRDVSELEQHIDFRLGPLAIELGSLKFDCAVVCSGAAKALAAMHAHPKSSDVFDANGFVLRRTDLSRIYSRICDLRDPPKLREEWNLDQNRSEIILAGTSILTALTRTLDVAEWTVSTGGLREGLVLDTFNRLQRYRSPALSGDVRWNSVLNLGKRLAIDRGQAERVMALVLHLYHSVLPAMPRLDKLDEVQMTDQEILQAAAWLHECGKFISFPRYHRHSNYLIINTRLMGFSQKERLFVGLVARFHRKGQATEKDPDCRGLSKNDLARVNLLAGMLRIAVAANRTRKGLITGVEVEREKDRIVLVFCHPSSVVPRLDLQNVIKEKTALEKALDRKVEVRSLPAAGT